MRSGKYIITQKPPGRGAALPVSRMLAWASGEMGASARMFRQTYSSAAFVAGAITTSPSLHRNRKRHPILHLPVSQEAASGMNANATQRRLGTISVAPFVRRGFLNGKSALYRLSVCMRCKGVGCSSKSGRGPFPDDSNQSDSDL